MTYCFLLMTLALILGGWYDSGPIMGAAIIFWFIGDYLYERLKERIISLEKRVNQLEREAADDHRRNESSDNQSL